MQGRREGKKGNNVRIKEGKKWRMDEMGTREGKGE